MDRSFVGCNLFLLLLLLVSTVYLSVLWACRYVEPQSLLLGNFCCSISVVFLMVPLWPLQHQIISLVQFKQKDWGNEIWLWLSDARTPGWYCKKLRGLLYWSSLYGKTLWQEEVTTCEVDDGRRVRYFVGDKDKYKDKDRSSMWVVAMSAIEYADTRDFHRPDDIEVCQS